MGDKDVPPSGPIAQSLTIDPSCDPALKIHDNLRESSKAIDKPWDNTPRDEILPHDVISKDEISQAFDEKIPPLPQDKNQFVKIFLKLLQI